MRLFVIHIVYVRQFVCLPAVSLLLFASSFFNLEALGYYTWTRSSTIISLCDLRHSFFISFYL